MLVLMTLRANHTITAMMFLVKALEKLSLGKSTLPPVCIELLLVMRRAGCVEELEFITISSLSKEVHRFSMMVNFWTLGLFSTT